MIAFAFLISSALAQSSNPQAQPVLTDPRVIRFKADIEEIRTLRKDTKLLYDRLEPIVNAKTPQPLNGDDLKELDLRAKKHSALSHELQSFIQLGRDEKIVTTNMSVPSAIDLALELAASLTYSDSIDQVISLFEASPKLRAIVDRSNPTYGRPADVLYQAMLNFYSVPFYDRRAKLINAYEILKHDSSLNSSPELQYLSSVITLSTTYQKYLAQTKSERFRERANIAKMRTELKAAKAGDRVQDFLTHRVMGQISEVFGNSVGSIQFRHGKIFGNKEIAKKMKEVLKPGDLLLEATPFRATSYFIPGFYGHVALWVGTENELKELDIWNSETIRPYQSEISRGSSILEALRTGVEINPVEHFLDIDDLLIIRPNEKISVDEIRTAILAGMTHVGQPYDFNFDANSSDRIVCSELAFGTYTSVRFRLEQTMGRWTIDPDAVAEQALPGGSFTPVLMVRDGKLLESNLEKALADELEKPKKKSGSAWPR